MFEGKIWSKPNTFSCICHWWSRNRKKSLIICIFYKTNKLLVILSDNTDELSVLKTAPNGAGAFNINGLTIYRALAIFKTLSADHAILSKDNVNV